MSDPWPLRHLVLRTPRLDLRPDDDAGLLELVDVARAGIHPPGEVPFTTPWSEAPDLGPATLRFHWQQRANVGGGTFTLSFLVRLDDAVIGTQSVRATDFAVSREVDTGSWLGQAFQGSGYGTEMRAAVLLFAFDHLGATQARSSAFSTSHASRRVSEKLGYRPDGTEIVVVGGRRKVDQRLVITPETFVRPSWTLQVEGDSGAVPFLASGQEPTIEP